MRTKKTLGGSILGKTIKAAVPADADALLTELKKHPKLALAPRKKLN
jgi:hypothetical protein